MFFFGALIFGLIFLSFFFKINKTLIKPPIEKKGPTSGVYNGIKSYYENLKKGACLIFFFGFFWMFFGITKRFF